MCVCFVKSQGLPAFASNCFPQKKQRQLETVKMRMEDNDKTPARSSGLLGCNGNPILVLRLYVKGLSPVEEGELHESVFLDPFPSSAADFLYDLWQTINSLCFSCVFY